MAFSDEVIKQAWDRAKRRCECTRSSHGHSYSRCPNEVVWENRGREGRGAWEAHHLNAKGEDVLSNCQILCWECHKQTLPGPGR